MFLWEMLILSQAHEIYAPLVFRNWQRLLVHFKICCICFLHVLNHIYSTDVYFTIYLVIYCIFFH